MSPLHLRAYEGALLRIANGPKVSDAQRRLLKEHARDVAQVRYLSDEQAIERDAAQLRAWLVGELQRLKPHMPADWPALSTALLQTLDQEPADEEE